MNDDAFTRWFNSLPIGLGAFISILGMFLVCTVPVAAIVWLIEGAR